MFTKTSNAVKVEFPDIDGCNAFGFDLADAYEMAFDKLFLCLPLVESQQVLNPSTYEDLRERYPRDNQVILPFLVDVKTVIKDRDL